MNSIVNDDRRHSDLPLLEVAGAAGCAGQNSAYDDCAITRGSPFALPHRWFWGVPTPQLSSGRKLQLNAQGSSSDEDALDGTSEPQHALTGRRSTEPQSESGCGALRTYAEAMESVGDITSVEVIPSTSVPVLSASDVVTRSVSNVSNVRIVPSVNNDNNNSSSVQCGAFTSTETQTDDVSCRQPQRRRDRRERRLQQQLRRVCDAVPRDHAAPARPPAALPNCRLLPDLVSHSPPPYSTLPHGTERRVGVGLMSPPNHPPPPPPPLPLPPSSPIVHQLPQLPLPPPQPAHLTGYPPPVLPFITSRRWRADVSTANSPPSVGSRGRHDGSSGAKSLCGSAFTHALSVRWLVIAIALVGVCCVIVGIVFGAMRSSIKEHITVSLLMISVGLMLITVSGVAWRLTARNSTSCRAMFGFGGSNRGVGVRGNAQMTVSVDTDIDPTGRFVSRMPPSCGRPHHPYAAMLYPEFQYHAPPPSYQASMQEYRLRLLLLDRSSPPPPPTLPTLAARSPPPSYRSQYSTLRPSAVPSASRPPSYRSRCSTTNIGDTSACHSRDSSTADAVTPKDTCSSKENLVTIVQTNDSATTSAGPATVVTVSSPAIPNEIHGMEGEVSILAHL